ncbi:permease [uncultured Sphingomonas sp.]|uniref:permease n=1 Tax=uncultured Sphingomonas sp. TaxID=158754 RepID=UPI0035CBF8CB
MSSVVLPQPVASAEPAAPAAVRTGVSRMALYVLLGFSAGLPFYMFSTVLSARLKEHGVALAVIGFFAWVQLLPTFKFLWAPLLDRYDVPGFGRFWGKRRGWIMLAQLGIFTSMLAMTVTASDGSLAVTALFAVLLAFWTTTLEIAADAWRIELAPTPEEQGPIAAANLWGYRTAMVAAGSGALLVADIPQWGWTGAYLLIAAAAFVPFPILAGMRPDPGHAGGRWTALATGLIAGAIILGVAALATAVIGWLVLNAAAGAGISADTNVTPWVLVISMLPFLIMAVALPRIRAARATDPIRASAAIGPYVDFFWRYGFMAIMLLSFVSVYRMGDVLALNLSKPMILGLGYTKSEIGRADGLVALASSVVGVGLGGWMVTRWRSGVTLSIGAVFAAIGNFGFVWLAHMPRDELTLYVATGLDQFGNGMAGAVFVVYLSMLVNPRYPGAQYAFLSGFAFLLSRLLSGAGGTMVSQLDRVGLNGFDIFFLASGVISLAALLFLPVLAGVKPRPDDA